MIPEFKNILSEHVQNVKLRIKFCHFNEILFHLTCRRNKKKILNKFTSKIEFFY